MFQSPNRQEPRPMISGARRRKARCGGSSASPSYAPTAPAAALKTLLSTRTWMPSSAAQDDEMRGKEIKVHHGAVGEVRDLVEARDRWDRRSPTNIDEDPYACAADFRSMTSTFWPAATRRRASVGPYCPVPMTIAS